MPEEGAGTVTGPASERAYRGVTPGQVYWGCVRGFQVNKGMGQEARPGELHLQRLYLEKNRIPGNSRLELQGGVGRSWGTRAWNFLITVFPDLGRCCLALLLCPSHTAFPALSPSIQIVHSLFLPLSY